MKARLIMTIDSKEVDPEKLIEASKGIRMGEVEEVNGFEDIIVTKEYDRYGIVRDGNKVSVFFIWPWYYGLGTFHMHKNGCYINDIAEIELKGGLKLKLETSKDKLGKDAIRASVYHPDDPENFCSGTWLVREGEELDTNRYIKEAINQMKEIISKEKQYLKILEANK